MLYVLICVCGGNGTPAGGCIFTLASLTSRLFMSVGGQVIGVPQPVLKWYKDGTELQPGDIHRIISGEDGTCCLGTYTCEAFNIMGSASSSAALLGFEGNMD